MLVVILTATCKMVCKGLSLAVCFTVWAAALTPRGWSISCWSHHAICAECPLLTSFVSLLRGGWRSEGKSGKWTRADWESNDWDLFQIPRKPDWPCPPPNPGYRSRHSSRQIFQPLRVRGAVPDPAGSPADPAFLHAAAPEARGVPHHVPREHGERAALHRRGNAQQDSQHLGSQTGILLGNGGLFLKRWWEEALAACWDFLQSPQQHLEGVTAGRICAASIKSTLQKPAALREGSHPSKNLSENGKNHISDSQKATEKHSRMWSLCLLASLWINKV